MIAPPRYHCLGLCLNDAAGLQAVNANAKSLDTILDAYREIAEQVPQFLQHMALFEESSDMRSALELYFCEILKFHLAAVKFLNRSRECFNFGLFPDPKFTNLRPAQILKQLLEYIRIKL